MGITGWVKNTADKNVEIMAHGTEEQLQKFEQWCHEGPSNAKVEKVIAEQVGEQQFDEFKILH
jgi:acylphosphatase